jgi:glycosyltransferase involved in cell wall biosynthesis
MRIAICPGELAPLRAMLRDDVVVNGTYVVQGYIARGLQKRSHNLTFLAPRNLDEVETAHDLDTPCLAARTWTGSRWFRAASRATWRVQRMLGVPYLNVFSNLRLMDACRQSLPGHDVVYERNGLYSTGIARACKMLGLPYVVFFEADQLMELEGIGRPVKGLLWRRAAGMLRYNLKIADRVICVSVPARDHLVARWHVPPEKTVVLPNGVDVRRFCPSEIARMEARTMWGLGDDPVVVFVGSFFAWHDVGALLDAFQRVLEVHPRARLLLAGDGDLRLTMEQRAASAGLSSSVFFTGLLPHGDIPRVLAAADVAVAPYPAMRTELWFSPLKLLEYMASGCAVVASAAGQVAEIIDDEKNGLLVPPGDTVAMAAAMTRIIGDRTLRARLGQQARADAVGRHSWAGYVSRLEQVCVAAIADHAGGGATVRTG